MKTIVIATSNQGKAREIEDILSNVPCTFTTLDQFPPITPPKEEGETFEENARCKALYYAEKLNLPALADDSGLEVQFLDGKPGVHTARLAGCKATDTERNEKLLSLLQGVPWEKRQASFICVAALAWPHGQVEICRGEVQGYIAEEMQGLDGFGYDPVFYVPQMGKTWAQLGKRKQESSHRAKAFRAMEKILQKSWQEKP